MARTKDLSGRKFGRLVVLYPTDERKNGRIIWHCKCDCGNETNVRSDSLTSGNTKSCGCYQRKRSAEVHTVHGMDRQGEQHPVYCAWHAMIQRCENPNDKRYKNYGARGIAVCLEWHDPQVFIEWALASGWEKGLSLDRIDNNGNYEPSNCHWVTRKENNRNKRNNHLITVNGKTQPMSQWAEEVEIKYSVLWCRICQLHWPIERALTEPARRPEHGS